ncbi:MAG: hypothetical protein KKG00_00685 [Bacteroidetes bacterium]|nr:hypothetical protein [Bacteroidota bacterium]
MTRYSFTYEQEIDHRGHSLVPHFPGGNSGVTIGPGYDLSHRSPQEIFNDLSAVGVDYEVIGKLIGAAQKSGTEAAAWVAEHGGIFITEEQQQALYEQVLVPTYEERTREQLFQCKELYGLTEAEIQWEQLSPRQQEALFDFVYNTGGLTRFPEFTVAVLQDDWESASLYYERFSGDMPLLYRNEMFYQKFILNIDGHSSGIESDENHFQNGEPDTLNAVVDDLYADPDNYQDDSGTDDWYEIQ